MKSKVYFTKERTNESLFEIYESINHELKGKVAIKISTGEPGGHNFLNLNLIKDLVSKLNGTIVECCTAYAGKRMNPKAPEIADIDIFASLYQVTIDKCCYDTIMNLTEEGANLLKKRMLDRYAIHTVNEAEKLGLGAAEYELVRIDR